MSNICQMFKTTSWRLVFINTGLL